LVDAAAATERADGTDGQTDCMSLVATNGGTRARDEMDTKSTLIRRRNCPQRSDSTPLLKCATPLTVGGPAVQAASGHDETKPGFCLSVAWHEVIVAAFGDRGSFDGKLYDERSILYNSYCLMTKIPGELRASHHSDECLADRRIR